MIALYVADIAEGNECSYIKTCIKEEDCKAVFSGEKREKKCGRNLFCRGGTTDTNCLVIGTCVAKANANSDGKYRGSNPFTLNLGGGKFCLDESSMVSVIQIWNRCISTI